MIRPDIKALAAYHVQDSTDMIKLDAMENPYVLPESLRQQWAASLASLEVNRYPDAEAIVLKKAIARHHGIHIDQILLGNGSDEIIQMLMLAIDPGVCVMPQPTFVMYDLIARWVKRPVATVPLTEGFDLPVDAFLRACAREKAVMAFLASPNNPTANAYPRAAIEKIIATFHGLLVIDEAYAPFSNTTHLDMVVPNVLVLRTFSKLGMAGLRLGYAIGHPDLIAQLNKVRLPYNISALNQAAGSFFLQHFDVFHQQLEKICAERDRVSVQLKQLKHVSVYPSQSNFILLHVPDADAVFEQMKTQGILIKNMHPSGGLLAQCLRVTIGLPGENNRFITTLKEILA